MIEKEIGGVKRAFHFATYTFKILSDEFGEKYVNNVMQRLAQADVPFWVTFAYACAKTACRELKTQVDFKEEDVYTWADELGMSEFEKLIAQLLDAYRTKNVKAPEAGQIQNQ